LSGKGWKEKEAAIMGLAPNIIAAPAVIGLLKEKAFITARTTKMRRKTAGTSHCGKKSLTTSRSGESAASIGKKESEKYG